MRTVGIIAEYCPFHAGHAHHLAQAKAAAHADRAVVVMSSLFTQRGELALLSPADRARMALACGADAVFALPVCWSCRDAEHFALGGVALLQGLGVDAISFGAETADLSLLSACAALLASPDASMSSALRRAMDAGLPYPAALSAAMQASHPELGPLLDSPNNTLAICYLRAMDRLDASMKVFPIPRTADYHATGLAAGFPSATALRSAIRQGNWAGCEASIPPDAYAILQEAALRRCILSPDALDQLLLHRLRTMTDTEWSALPDLSEGIDDRLRAAARTASSREALLLAAKTRRYPHARLSRLCVHALLGITQDQLAAEPLPTAAWLLGFRQEAASILSKAKQNGLAIISKAADHSGDEAWFRTELAAYELWALAARQPAGMGYTQGVWVEK